jgi:CheY-like chemotaxis protein
VTASAAQKSGTSSVPRPLGAPRKMYDRLHFARHNGVVPDLIALVLRNAGFVVRTAVNGLEGLLTAYEMRPDVIVMDLAMPVLNGLEATRLIKATQATRESRVIAYTGNGSIPPLETWFVAIVSKPSPPNIVLAAVQNAVSS